MLPAQNEIHIVNSTFVRMELHKFASSFVDDFRKAIVLFLGAAINYGIYWKAFLCLRTLSGEQAASFAILRHYDTLIYDHPLTANCFLIKFMGSFLQCRYEMKIRKQT